MRWLGYDEGYIDVGCKLTLDVRRCASPALMKSRIIDRSLGL